ncbi:MAG: DUF3078 domain-containing protein [Chitinophagales bacterium]|nr:DUF3078 domain-containing protein [Chitinophagales bacterium]
MKKLYILFSVIIFSSLSLNSFAQKDEALEAVKRKDNVSSKLGEVADTAVWKWGGLASFQFGQTALVNWAAGGNSQISVNIHGYFYANLIKKRHIWENSFDGNWGIVKFKGEGPQINQNLFLVNSQYGFKLRKNLFASALVNLQSPFSKGFDYSEDPKLFITQFAAPMYIKTAVGIDYKPNEYFSFFVSPVAGKFTIVANDEIAALDRYIPATTDLNGNRYYNSHFRAEFGALARASFQKEIFKNVNLRSTLELFNNYTDVDKSNRKNIDIDWQTGVDLKVNEWLVVSVFTHLIYDNNTNWLKEDGNGNPVNLKDPETGVEYLGADGLPIQQKTTAVQFRENLTVGLTYKFGHKEGL